MVHLHNVDNSTAGFFFKFTEFTIQLTHLQTIAALDNGLQATIALGISRIHHGHHFILIRQNQSLGIGHFHLTTPVRVED